MEINQSEWTVENSAALYGVDLWGTEYFSINKEGNIDVRLPTSNEKIDLYKLTLDLQERGIRTPLLVRFPGLIRERVQLISSCFNNSISEYGYKGKYTGVFPIKVNQQRHLVEEIVEFGKFSRLGLECGSKPELLVALAYLDTPGAYIICNGFKDQEYIETALLSQKLGRNTIVVVDRAVELDLILAASRKLQIRPRIGFRVKLHAQATGKWNESSGAKSKFGLTPTEMVSGIRKLQEADLIDTLELVHFHVGSQISSIQSIKLSIKEGARYYTELHGLGAKPSIIDVGGGLGIDYDGSSGKSDSSTNYSEQEYANDVVSIIQSICDEKKVPHPDIISESGRSLVAHSSVLIFDVLGINDVSRKSIYHDFSDKDTRLVLDLYDLWQNLKRDSVNEHYNDLLEIKRDIQQLFAYGVLSLEQRAKADDLYWACASKLCDLARNNDEAGDIYWELEKELCDTYFCNFSVFQSLPDSWAVGQIFPVAPIHRLNERPSRRATLADLTCDSDGKLDCFIDTDTEETQKYLEVHELKSDEPYLLGVFLAGAYQETLGDLHNLFGDTDAVHITLGNDGYAVEHFVQGDSVREVLSYVQYSKSEMLERIRKGSESSIQKGTLSRADARLLLKVYEEGLDGYTYLEQEE
ncbi:MAG: biosynthetic arginine decarboxylase [Bdellovibrionales bacterium]|nr:biosynthetic arginine decarboxylase [Bdellovibrionales bacterium]